MAKFDKKRRFELDEHDIADGITYDGMGRMKYHPEFHTNHGARFTEEELVYLCKFYDYDGSRSMAFALGKTEQTVMNKVFDLRKSGKFEIYKNMSDEEWIKLGGEGDDHRFKAD